MRDFKCVVFQMMVLVGAMIAYLTIKLVKALKKDLLLLRIRFDRS
jgi:hypothetical protein